MCWIDLVTGVFILEPKLLRVCFKYNKSIRHNELNHQPVYLFIFAHDSWIATVCDFPRRKHSNDVMGLRRRWRWRAPFLSFKEEKPNFVGRSVSFDLDPTGEVIYCEEVNPSLALWKLLFCMFYIIISYQPTVGIYAIINLSFHNNNSHIQYRSSIIILGQNLTILLDIPSLSSLFFGKEIIGRGLGSNLPFISFTPLKFVF